MTCSVESDKPVTLTWTGPNGDILTPLSHTGIVLDTATNGDLTLVFKTLRTSFGGVYTCTADLGGATSAQTKYLHHLLKVKSKLKDLKIRVLSLLAMH